MKGIGALGFFLFWTVLGAAGVVMAVKGGLWLLVISFLAYLGMLIKWGCLAETH